jgi:RimJ/RimL family protein N-acetyltransferase
VFNHLMDRLERAYSPRLALRRLSVCDGWPLFVATRDPQFNKHLSWHQPPDEAVVLERVDAIAGAARRGRLAALSAVVRQTGEWVSLYRFIPYGDDATTLEMGVWTHSHFWRGHYTQELTRMAIDAAFRCSKIDRLVAAVMPDNSGSCRVLHNVGLQPFQHVTRFMEFGQSAKLLEHQIMRGEWERSLAAEPSYHEVPHPDEFTPPAPLPLAPVEDPAVGHA